MKKHKKASLGEYVVNEASYQIVREENFSVVLAKLWVVVFFTVKQDDLDIYVIIQHVPYKGLS